MRYTKRLLIVGVSLTLLALGHLPVSASSCSQPTFDCTWSNNSLEECLACCDFELNYNSCAAQGISPALCAWWYSCTKAGCNNGCWVKFNNRDW